jgi:hypothetical protein
VAIARPGTSASFLAALLHANGTTADTPRPITAKTAMPTIGVGTPVTCMNAATVTAVGTRVTIMTPTPSATRRRRVVRRPS